ncbi:CsbD family protein [Gandjariella thermophila]|uniref:CsbD family protein n=1 Tax=Gandjariella thermophila TaxID=1931992 RepID=A0A4D4JD42_9PSEU|nr:CsbD family protein [Gandjariella thermophila]GDY32316.1 CsbD family protein [Gandjariella thermophila]
MGADDKMRNKGQEIRGRAKKATGDATGNEQWQAEGRVEQFKSNLKQAAEKVKDAFRNRS